MGTHRHLRRVPLLLGLCAILTAPPALAQSGDINARVTRLERTLGSSALLQMLDTMKQLRREVRDLRGQIEVQANEIRRLKQSQKKLYVDLDQRIETLRTAPPVAVAETGSETVNTAPAPTASPAAPTAVAAAAPAAATVPAPAATDPAEEQAAYRAAFDLLKAGKFSKASGAFSAFLNDYPNGRFADNAQYWLGESYYVSREFGPAMKAFESLVADFPDSPKRGHALLKIGFIHDEAGRKDEARKVLQALIAEDPSSTAAGLAQKRLSRIQ